MKQVLLLSLFASLLLPRKLFVSAFTRTPCRVDIRTRIQGLPPCSPLSSSRQDDNLEDLTDKSATSVSPLKRKPTFSHQIARNRGRLKAVSLAEQESIKPITDRSNETLISQTPSLLTGRALVVIASIVYGTNFATVKMLNAVLPLGASALVRFGLAAIVVTAAVLFTEDGQVSTDIREERSQSTIRGMEVGAWYAIGYIAQATSLLTQDASKVSQKHSLQSSKNCWTSFSHLIHPLSGQYYFSECLL